jgi:transcriptional regulator with XRE-family HTH domain
MDIGKQIKRIREAQKLTQEQVALSIGLDNSSYARIEKKVNKISIDQLEKIASSLGVSLVELLTGEKQKIEDTDKVKDLEKRIGELEDLSKIQKDFILSIKQKFTGTLIYEFFYTAVDLGLLDENGNIVDELGVAKVFFNDNIINEIFINGLIDENEQIYKDWLAMFSRLGKIRYNEIDMRRKLYEEFKKNKANSE